MCLTCVNCAGVLEAEEAETEAAVQDDLETTKSSVKAGD